MATPTRSDTSPSSTTALVLGGGGPVGRAWETGLAAGFLDLGLDLGRADLIIGTSAGSIVGAELALGLDVSHAAPVVDSSSRPAPSPASSSLMQQLITASARAATSSKPEVEWEKIGRMALAAPTGSEEESLARATFAAVTGQEWPSNFWATSISARTGRMQVWSASSKVPLERAVASSAALPGLWPPITIGDDRYMDGGVRSMLNSDLAAGYARVVVVSCFALTAPRDTTAAATTLNRALVDEIELLRSGGSVVEVVAPDEAFLALTKNGTMMLNNALVPDAYTAGKGQAHNEVDRIRRVWTVQVPDLPGRADATSERLKSTRGRRGGLVVSDMDTEIREQPGVVAALSEADPKPYAEVCRAAKRAGLQFVVYVGRGTSDNAAVYGQYLTATQAGLPSGLALPSATTLYDADLDLRHCLVIGISQSGETPEVAETVAYAETHGALTVAVTNNISSALANAAAWTLPTNAGTERSVAATKTYTAELAVLALLWATWANNHQLLADLRETIPAAMQQALETADAIGHMATALVESERLLVVARGYNLATALETSLKIQETAGIAALAYSGADLVHGPIAMLDPGMPVVCFAPSGKTQGSVLEVITTLRQRGARVLLVAPEHAAALLDPKQGSGTEAGRTRRQRNQYEWIPLMDVPEPLSPLVAIIPGQLLACSLAVGRGRDPDRPKGLDKVTHTR